MFLLWIGLAYLGIGLIWSIFTCIVMLDVFESTKDAIGCFVWNILLWPLIMILAFAFFRGFKNAGGH